MWYVKLQHLCAKYQYLYIPAVALIPTGLVVWQDGPGILVFLFPIMIVILSIALRGLQKAQTELEKFKSFQEAHKTLLVEHQSLQVTTSAFSRERSFWLNKYLDLRLDRAAMLKMLSRILPAGYRIESYMLETPLSSFEHNYGTLEEERKRDHFGPDANPTQTFLYLDYDQNNPAAQLRVRVNAKDIEVIGDLPDYEKGRVCLFEADGREAWRRWLMETSLKNTAVEHSSNQG